MSRLKRSHCFIPSLIKYEHRRKNVICDGDDIIASSTGTAYLLRKRLEHQQVYDLVVAAGVGPNMYELTVERLKSMDAVIEALMWA